MYIYIYIYVHAVCLILLLVINYKSAFGFLINILMVIGIRIIHYQYGNIFRVTIVIVKFYYRSALAI